MALLNPDFLANLILEEKFKEALSVLRELITDNISCYSVRCFAHTFRGIILEEKVKDIDAAIEEFTQAINMDPECPDAYQHRANLYDETGDFAKAIRDYNKLVELQPYNDTHFFNRGCVFKKIGWHQKSLLDLNRAIELKFDGHYLLIRGSLQKYHLKSYNDALADFEWALQDPTIDRGTVHLQKAHTYILMGNVSDAASSLDKALFCSSRMSIMRHYVEGLIRQHQNRLIDAELCFSRFLKESSYRANCHLIAVEDTKRRLRKMLTKGFGLLSWTICRVIWIGNIKNSSRTCVLAAVPRDVLKLIIVELKNQLYDDAFPFYL